MENISYLIVLILSLIVLIIMSYVLSKKSKKKGQINQAFNILLVCMILWTGSLVLQILCQNLPISPVFFEGLASFGACFIPIAFLYLSAVYSNTKVQFKRIYLLLFVIPILSTILMFTNESHHLFFQVYSTNMNEVVPGPYHIINAAFSYICMFTALFFLLRQSIKTSGFFSKQSIPVFLGALVPVVINVLGTFGIINMSVYITPISFTFTILCFSLAILKFDFLRVTPIALQRVVDRMSDSYIVLDDNYKVIDFNKPFIETTKVNSNILRNMDVYTLLVKSSDLNFSQEELDKIFQEVNTQSSKTISLEKKSNKLSKYFNIEFSAIHSNKSVLRFFDSFQRYYSAYTRHSNNSK